MKHDVTDARVQETLNRVKDEPQALRPKANQKNERDGGLDLGTDRNRVQLEPQILKRLTQEVKETVAKDIKLPRTVRSFSVVDLWNLRRNRRYRAHTRKQPTIHTGLRG